MQKIEHFTKNVTISYSIFPNTFKDFQPDCISNSEATAVASGKEQNFNNNGGIFIPNEGLFIHDEGNTIRITLRFSTLWRISRVVADDGKNIFPRAMNKNLFYISRQNSQGLKKKIFFHDYGKNFLRLTMKKVFSHHYEKNTFSTTTEKLGEIFFHGYGKYFSTTIGIISSTAREKILFSRTSAKLVFHDDRKIFFHNYGKHFSKIMRRNIFSGLRGKIFFQY